MFHTVQRNSCVSSIWCHKFIDQHILRSRCARMIHCKFIPRYSLSRSRDDSFQISHFAKNVCWNAFESFARIFKWIPGKMLMETWVSTLGFFLKYWIYITMKLQFIYEVPTKNGAGSFHDQVSGKRTHVSLGRPHHFLVYI